MMKTLVLNFIVIVISCII